MVCADAGRGDDSRACGFWDYRASAQRARPEIGSTGRADAECGSRGGEDSARSACTSAAGSRRTALRTTLSTDLAVFRFDRALRDCRAKSDVARKILGPRGRSATKRAGPLANTSAKCLDLNCSDMTREELFAELSRMSASSNPSRPGVKQHCTRFGHNALVGTDSPVISRRRE